jgi:hypothetical protein
MKTIFLLLAVVFVGCEKDEPTCVAQCGILIDHSRTGTPPSYQYNYVIQDDCGKITEVSGIYSVPYISTTLGEEICLDEIW